MKQITVNRPGHLQYKGPKEKPLQEEKNPRRGFSVFEKAHTDPLHGLLPRLLILKVVY
jgi:hypothetical protein